MSLLRLLAAKKTEQVFSLRKTENWKYSSRGICGLNRNRLSVGKKCLFSWAKDVCVKHLPLELLRSIDSQSNIVAMYLINEYNIYYLNNHYTFWVILLINK